MSSDRSGGAAGTAGAPHADDGGAADEGAEGEVDVDVAIVGGGPVGQLLGILLGQYGRRVVILERWPDPYPLPRAVVFDDEVARVLAGAGLAEEATAISEAADVYEWRNAAGATLLRMDWGEVSASGWPVANMFSQPVLEEVLGRRLATLTDVEVRRGATVTGVVDHGDCVTVRFDQAGETGPDGSGSPTLWAKWVVGCDGANSFVRSTMDTTVTDLGFYFDWLIVDVILREPRVWQPMNLQICDPARPTTLVSGGPGRRRWEFMRLEGETIADLATPERAWQLLEPWDVTADNAAIERHAVYTFAAQWADRWRDGRRLVAGDAAHLMPPFAGQGLCSGLRDAANLAWKLDLTLKGHADDGLVDTYTPERSGHVQNAIALSVALGNVICVTDPAEVAERDAFMTSMGGDPARLLPPLPPTTLTGGPVQRSDDGTPAPGGGVLGYQGRVHVAGRTGRFDEVVGTGFVVAALDDPATALGAEQLRFLHAIGAHLVHLVPPDVPGGTRSGPPDGAPADAPAAEVAATATTVRVVDLDSTYHRTFATGGYRAAVTRPDFYVFGTSATIEGMGALVDDLRSQLDRTWSTP